MKYLKTYESQTNDFHNFNVGDIVRYKGFVSNENDVEKEKIFIIKNVHDGFGRVYWYDMENAYEDIFGIVNTMLSVTESDLVKISPEQTAKVKLDIEANKYNL